MTASAHGPWIDVHAHPGRCFLSGLAPSSPFVELLGAPEPLRGVRSAAVGEVAVVNTATVADLAVLGVQPTGGLYAAREFEPGEARFDHDRQITALADIFADSDVHPVLAPADIPMRTAARQGPHTADSANDDPGTGVFISCEGADFLDGDLAGLASVYARGARSVTLVHYRVNELGDIQTAEPVHGGLTRFGQEVVIDMNRLGMIVDLAHATFEATIDALEASAAPIMISHSHLAKPGADHPRLLSPAHARAVAEAGGLIGAWPAGVALATLDDYCEEICRLIDVVGLEHVAIGTDLDANFHPVLTSYEQFPEVAAGLGERGLSPSEVDQVLGGNFVDLFTAVTGIKA